MAGKYEAPRGRRRRRRKNNTVKILIILILVLSLGLGGMMLLLNGQPDPAGPGETQSGISAQTTVPTETTVPPTTEPEVIHVVSQATIATTGDLLMHLPVVNEHAQGNGTYNFDRAFQYLRTYSETADYAIANLETTLAGTDNGYAYSGYPCFNCPDSLVDSTVTAGFDLLLTANNHTYDTRHVGMMRTLEIIADRGIKSLGTFATAETPKYLVEEINGIKIGMICYTYETYDDAQSRVSLNTIPVSQEDAQCLNSFDYSYLDAFYAEMEEHIAAMEAEGAEGLMLFIHWGDEYMLAPNEKQQAIAQKMCDLGIDVIVGGHPHVVQPMELLTSTVDPEQKTVCVYSVGNALSNQSRNTISRTPQGHCEDGMLFYVTFSRYSDGTVALEGTDVLPTWVNWMEAHNKYNILPLDAATMDEWQTLYNLADNVYATALASYDRTMALVGEGLTACQTYLAEEKAEREEYYYNLAWGLE